MFKRIKSLIEKRGISINEAENQMGLSKNFIYTLEKRKPRIDKLEIIANYLNVTTDYLLGREDINANLTNKDKKDIADYMQSLRDDLANGQGIHFYGEPIDDEDVDIILRQLEFGAEMILKNKKKQMAGD